MTPLQQINRWIEPGAVVPIDFATTLALIAEIKRLRNVTRRMGALIEDAEEMIEHHTCPWCENSSSVADHEIAP